MGRLKLSGARFGRLVVRESTSLRDNGKIVWECLCDCGSVVFLNTTRLNTGNTKSCGCLRAEGNRKTHGGRSLPEYGIWRHMLSRCENKNLPAYKDYGGRGIGVCQRWHDFALFLEDMGRRPSVRHSIDRIDNSRGYEPGNCRWATPKEQNRNRRDSCLLDVDGVIATLAEHCERAGVKYSTAHMRLSKGAEPRVALSAGRIPYKSLAG